MPISEHPAQGTILICNFDGGFKVPEMVKPRLVVVLSPRIRARAGLSTVVALSTTPPVPPMPYHCQISIDPPLPRPWQSEDVWVKGDMINAVGLHRLDFIRLGKAADGRRMYRLAQVSDVQMRAIRTCVLHALGLGGLPKHL